jgi:hypothetical protein
MSVAKRRRVSGPTTTKPRGLDAFTRVSKTTTPGKEILEKTAHVENSVVSQVAGEDILGRKRRLVTVDEIEVEAKEEVPVELSPTVQKSRPIKPLPTARRFDPSKIPQTPQKPIPSSQASTPAETPTKAAANLLDRLFLSSASKAQALDSPVASEVGSVIDIDTTYTPIEQDIIKSALPQELLDLVNLHSAFLTALSLHYAHNGTHTPADLRLLCPDVARAWGKRKVLLGDIRRALGVLNYSFAKDEYTPPKQVSILSLSDYGYGKICIEIRGGAGKLGRMARPLDEERMNDRYFGALRRLWEKRADTGIAVEDFIEDLPMEPITTCASLVKMSPLLAKGQRRLEDLKAGIILKTKSIEPVEKEVVPISEQSKGAQKRGSGLLERLRAKQLHQSTLPAAPTKAELAKKYALGRLMEVASVVALLSTSGSAGQQRVSYTVPTILGKLKDSFKTPISKDEAENCLRLLATDIAPEWVKLVKIGKMDAMVVDRDGRPHDQVLEERIKRNS